MDVILRGLRPASINRWTVLPYCSRWLGICFCVTLVLFTFSQDRRYICNLKSFLFFHVNKIEMIRLRPASINRWTVLPYCSRWLGICFCVTLVLFTFSQDRRYICNLKSFLFFHVNKIEMILWWCLYYISCFIWILRHYLLCFIFHALYESFVITCYVYEGMSLMTFVRNSLFPEGT